MEIPVDGRPVLQKRRSTIKFEDDGMPSAIRPRDRRRLTSPPPPYARRAGRRFRARGHRAATRQEEQEQGETAMDWPAVVNIGGGDQPVRMFSLAWYICYFVAVMTICRLYTWVISRQFPSEPDS